ncbi:MAG TPA: hypothetical protein VL175_07295 [Pirellulales bacterium]|jgi:hypothetical protein|nr:hypothetical protein [Pirellulales bacterium]
MRNRVFRLLAAILLTASIGRGGHAAELPLLLTENFDNGASRWQPMDSKSWKIIDTPRGKAFSLFQQSEYKPPYRSPVNIAILKQPVVSDFSLEVDVQSTVPDYNHRSLVMVFGYQDPAHFYYVHFGKKTDNNANQIFIVDGAARVKISSETNPGTHWDDNWHKVRVVRDATDGDIEVYFDDMRKRNTAMEAIDRTFTWGQVGLGAFDDLGNFAHVVLKGNAVARPNRPASESK